MFLSVLYQSRPALTVSSFQANQLQLAGPVPAALYHRYVEFRPFVKGMFTSKSFRGWILHRALQHQHNRIYNYSKKHSLWLLLISVPRDDP